MRSTKLDDLLGDKVTMLEVEQLQARRRFENYEAFQALEKELQLRFILRYVPRNAASLELNELVNAMSPPQAQPSGFEESINIWQKWQDEAMFESLAYKEDAASLTGILQHAASELLTLLNEQYRQEDALFDKDSEAHAQRAARRAAAEAEELCSQLSIGVAASPTPLQADYEARKAFLGTQIRSLTSAMCTLEKEGVISSVNEFDDFTRIVDSQPLKRKRVRESSDETPQKRRSQSSEAASSRSLFGWRGRSISGAAAAVEEDVIDPRLARTPSLVEEDHYFSRTQSF